MQGIEGSWIFSPDVGCGTLAQGDTTLPAFVILDIGV
jgi:hypothetical protein